MATKKTSAPWEQDNPKKSSGEETTHLSPTQKASAKKAAKKAGRPYPNLVDNMQAAKKGGTKTAAKKTTAKKAAKKAPAKKAAAKKAAKKATSA